ncbi:MAG: ATP-binding protein [Anaerolineales bacterium]|nr:ATP-binding protein [Anaerolineales bacterium]
MKFDFRDRQRELKLLDKLWKSKHAEFLILYGRRRIGKTTLLSEWIRRNSRRALYWVASSTSAVSQLRSFSQAVYNFSNPDAPAPNTFTYASWEQAFRQIAALAENERLACFIDEFTYLLEVSPETAGQLQNLWDHLLSQRNLFLCLSGSHLGMMKREFLSYQAPLYGRASAQLHLQPLPFGSTARFFPNYSATDRVAIYAIFGGVPAYWERIDPAQNISQNIKSNLLTPNNLLQAEPRLLLQDFVTEPHNYIGILSAIGNGAHTIKDIAALSGLSSGHVTKYLSILTNTGFVERRIPATDRDPSRSGRYHITDPYLRFYFRFLESRQEQLALNIQKQALAEINKHMIDFIGTYTWEELCREWTLRAGAAGELPFLSDTVGSGWNRAAQVDVVGYNSMEKTLILGECKWTRTPNNRKPIVDLIEKKAKNIIPAQGDWQVAFIGFSRAGWTSGAISYLEEINRQPPSGPNWRAYAAQLIDLDQLDRDLQIWTS